MALSLNNNYDWVFVPYNHEYKNRNKKLIAELNNEGFDSDRIISDPKYVLDEIIKDVGLTKKQGGKRFKAIYDRLSGSINQNSMVVYSGPLRNQNYHKYCQNRNCWDLIYYEFCSSDRVGCVYTGDTDLNVVNIKSILNFLWKNVGTIQIPHHGDIKAFDKLILSGSSFCCPISFGTNNSYGHPSTKIIGEIRNNQSCPISITEKLDSFHVEIIEIQ